MASIMNKATMLHLIQLEGAAANPALIQKKYELGTSLTLASRCIDLSAKGYVKRVPAPAGAKERKGMPSAWWGITKVGERYLKEHPDEIKTIEQLQTDLASGVAKRTRGEAAPALALNAHANGAVDAISKLIDNYNQSLGMIKQIHRLTGEYLKANQVETGS